MITKSGGSMQLEHSPGGKAAQARALFYEAPYIANIRTLETPILTEHDGGKAEAVTQTLYSGLSRGTERLVFEGRLPRSEWGRMRAPNQTGEFPFPVKYGYAAVGVVGDGPYALIGRTVFALYPHQTHFVLPANSLIPLPEAIPARRAILAANMETALNVVWDGELRPGQTVAVIGAGLVGCLVASLAARMPGTKVTLIDVLPERAGIAAQLGAAFATPDEAQPGAEVIFHTSASEAGLRLALDIAAFEARIVEVSWYGDKEVSLPLGGAFHSQRLQLVSSQVGSVAPSMRARLTHRQRLETALSLLDDARLDALITEDVAFDDLPAALPRLLAADAPGIATAIRY
jgi:NADPH:quinone reductase-like Zn-dependent oxidoreductase